MKKQILFVTVLIFISYATLHAQDKTKESNVYSIGTNVASVGVGLGSSIAGYSYGSQSPAISLQYERGLWEVGPGVISLGGYLGFKTYKYSGSGYSYKWSYTIIGVRGAYHLTQINVKNLDLYGGVMLAYNNLHFTDNQGNSTVSYGSTTGFSIFLGGRYYFTQNIGAFLELGYGVAYANLGLALKF